MKKITILSVLLFAIVSAKSQSLVNTVWLGTNPPSPNLFFSFSTDTLYYSMGSSYTPLSTYTAVSGQFSIFDIPGASLCSDTGHYNYSITGNNLIFTLISDNCSSRRNTLLNYNWTLFNAGIDDKQYQDNITVFPNPACDGFFTIHIPGIISKNNEIILVDMIGKIVYKSNLQMGETSVDISLLPHGIYTGVYRCDSGNKTFRIIR